MGKAKKTRKFAEVKRMLNPKDIQPYATPTPRPSGLRHLARSFLP